MNPFFSKRFSLRAILSIGSEVCLIGWEHSEFRERPPLVGIGLGLGDQGRNRFENCFRLVWQTNERIDSGLQFGMRDLFVIRAIRNVFIKSVRLQLSALTFFRRRLRALGSFPTAAKSWRVCIFRKQLSRGSADGLESQARFRHKELFSGIPQDFE